MFFFVNEKFVCKKVKGNWQKIIFGTTKSISNIVDEKLFYIISLSSAVYHATIVCDLSYFRSEDGMKRYYDMLKYVLLVGTYSRKYK